MTLKSGLLTAYLLSLTTTTCDAFSVTPSSILHQQHATTSSVDTILLQRHPQQQQQQQRYTTIQTFAKKDAESEDEPPTTKEEQAKEDELKEAAETPTTAASDILSSPSFLKRKLDVLKTDTAAVQEKMDAQNEVFKANKEEWGSQIDNLRTEYTNIEDRFKKMSKSETNTETMNIARKLLEVLDNFDRAFSSVTPETDAEQAVEASYKETYQMVLDTFKELGITEVDTVGKEFDYEFHQAVMTRPVEGFEEGVVCEELAKGYAMEDGKLIRAAMVVVAA